MELDMTTAITQDIAVLGDLPQWDLADLYPATDSAELGADLDRAARASRAFSDRWKGKLAGLSGDVLGKAIAEYEAIDEIMKLGCNFPMGPLRLADFIGLDVCHDIMMVLYRELGDQKFFPCPLLRQLVTAGRLGDKTGQGVYSYGEG